MVDYGSQDVNDEVFLEAINLTNENGQLIDSAI
jgi:hypothetical protein